MTADQILAALASSPRSPLTDTASNYVTAHTDELSVLDDPINTSASQDPCHDRRSPGHIRVVLDLRDSKIIVSHVEGIRPDIHGRWDGHGATITDQMPAWLAEHMADVNAALRAALPSEQAIEAIWAEAHNDFAGHGKATPQRLRFLAIELGREPTRVEEGLFARACRVVAAQGWEDRGMDRADADRLARATDHVDAMSVGDGLWAYYADETSAYYVLSSEELAELCDYLDDPDPCIARDAYSHWCAGSLAQEMPEGWEPGDDLLGGDGQGEV